MSRIVNRINRKLYKKGRRAIAPFIIVSIILLVVSFKPLYYFDIYYLNIESKSGLGVEEIKKNYDYLIKYNISVKREDFHLPSIKYSAQGKQHFIEVRRIFRILIFLGLVFGIISIFGVLGAVSLREYRIFRYIGMWTILLPAILLVPFALDFDTSFVVFHKIFFRNDYWIFNPAKDPVINILPQEFFMHCAFMILGLLLLVSIMFFILYKLFKDEFKEKIP